MRMLTHLVAAGIVIPALGVPPARDALAHRSIDRLRRRSLDATS
jgi:hypothetical protein